MVKLVNESVVFAHDDFKDWNWLFFNNKESDCILYSEDGHEFRIHKEILSQTKKMRNILSNSKDGCCGAMQIICPCSKDVLEYMVKFLYTGTILYEKEMDLFKILNNLTEIFGFPKNLFSEEDCYKALILDEASEFETIEELEIADEYHKMYPTETDDLDSENSILENSFIKNFDKPLKKQISDTNRDERVPKKDPTMISIKRNGPKIFKCDNCETSFKSKTNLRKHIEAVHEGKKPNKCEFCDAAFYRKVHLTRHVTSFHEGRKHYKCNICVDSFTSRRSLEGHLSLVHDGQKPFKCDRCDAGFMGKYNLKLHIKVVHEGNKPYKCSVCIESFTSKRSLEGHFGLIHNGHKPFKCDRCGKDFMKRCTLNSHIDAVHEGKKRFKCSFCNEEFSKKVDQKIHISTVHKEEKAVLVQSL